MKATHYIITGNTYDIRDSIKSAGGSWDKGRKAWIMTAADYEAACEKFTPSYSGAVFNRWSRCEKKAVSL